MASGVFNADQQHIAYVAVIIVGVGIADHLCCGGRSGIIREAAHVDPRGSHIPGGLPVPAAVHGDTAGGQDLGSKILAVSAPIVEFCPIGIAGAHPLHHVVVGRRAVIGVITGHSGGISLRIKLTVALGDIGHDGAIAAVSAGRTVMLIGIEQAVIALVVRHLPQRAVPFQPKVMSHIELLRQDA